jgi:hypothetical protein
MGQIRTVRTRRDGWTPERQLRFLDALVRTRSVTRAAAFAGMSRESAYRLRRRSSAALFAAAWDRALQPQPVAYKSHTRPTVEHQQALPPHFVQQLFFAEIRQRSRN